MNDSCLLPLLGPPPPLKSETADQQKCPASTRKGYVMSSCPMCNGKGYVNKPSTPSMSSDSLNIYNRPVTKCLGDCDYERKLAEVNRIDKIFTLPAIPMAGHSCCAATSGRSSSVMSRNRTTHHANNIKPGRNGVHSLFDMAAKDVFSQVRRSRADGGGGGGGGSLPALGCHPAPSHELSTTEGSTSVTSIVSSSTHLPPLMAPRAKVEGDRNTAAAGGIPGGEEGDYCENSGGGDDYYYDDDDLFPVRSLENIAEASHRAVVNLKSSDWISMGKGLEEAVQVLRFGRKQQQAAGGTPQLMATLSRTVIKALSSPKQYLVRMACRAASLLYSRVQVVYRPEFDDTMDLLLRRTADKSRGIAEDARTALLTLIRYSPVKAVVRAITSHAPKHRNAVVRESACEMLLRLYKTCDPQVLFIQPGFKETRKRVVETSAMFLTDTSQKVRTFAKQLFTLMVREPNFDEVFTADVDSKTIKRTEKQIILIKYGKAAA